MGFVYIWVCRHCGQVGKASLWFIFQSSAARLICRLNMPQKLSKSTLWVPCSHLMVTSTSLSTFACRTCTLKPNAGSSSSSSSEPEFSCMVSLLVFSAAGRITLSRFCLLRLAERDQTFSLANPTPAEMEGRYCHRMSRSLIVVLTLETTESSEILLMEKVNSEGKGRRCLGSVALPLATSLIRRQSLVNLPSSLGTCLFPTIDGRIVPQLHATPHLLVLPPCTNVFTAQFSIPLSLSFSTIVPTLPQNPSMVVYHCTRSFRKQLSSIIRLTKETSPPGVTISTSAPVHEECGGRDLALAEARSSSVEA